MYTLAGLYLLTPILSRWLRQASAGEVRLYLFLWAVTLTFPYLKCWLSINESITGPLYYFAGYAGYFVLGYYVTRHYRWRPWHMAVVACVAVAAPIAVLISPVRLNFYDVLWYLSLPVALMTFAIFATLRRFAPRRPLPGLTRLSSLTFGIYFIHIFIMRQIVWQLPFVCRLPSLLQIAAIFVMTFALSWLLTWLISKLPFSRHIIGV